MEVNSESTDSIDQQLNTLNSLSPDCPNEWDTETPNEIASLEEYILAVSPIQPVLEKSFQTNDGLIIDDARNDSNVTIFKTPNPGRIMLNQDTVENKSENEVIAHQIDGSIEGIIESTPPSSGTKPLSCPAKTWSSNQKMKNLHPNRTNI